MSVGLVRIQRWFTPSVQFICSKTHLMSFPYWGPFGRVESKSRKKPLSGRPRTLELICKKHATYPDVTRELGRPPIQVQVGSKPSSRATANYYISSLSQIFGFCQRVMICLQILKASKIKLVTFIIGDLAWSKVMAKEQTVKLLPEKEPPSQ